MAQCRNINILQCRLDRFIYNLKVYLNLFFFSNFLERKNPYKVFVIYCFFLSVAQLVNFICVLQLMQECSHVYRHTGRHASTPPPPLVIVLLEHFLYGYVICMHVFCLRATTANTHTHTLSPSLPLFSSRL